MAMPQLIAYSRLMYEKKASAPGLGGKVQLYCCNGIHYVCHRGHMYLTLSCQMSECDTTHVY